MKKLHGLSVILITRDEEDDVRGCLESVKDIADEIIVADSGSTDRTLEICRQYTDKVFFCEWKGYAPQKQFALDKAQGPWVLNLDADERLTDELKKEITSVLNSATSAPVNGYSIPFRTYFLGKRLRFGASWGETHVRFFRKEKASYGADPVHEGIKLDRPIGRFNGLIEHFSYGTLSEYLSKCNLYTTLIAEKKFKKGERFKVWRHLRLPFEFFTRYILKLGFLDGSEGLVYALLSSYYVWLKFVKLWEMERK